MNHLRFLCVVLFVVVCGFCLPLIGQDTDTPSADKKVDSEPKDSDAKDDEGKNEEAKEKRLPVPSEATVKETTKLVQDIYKSEIKKANTSALKQALAKKLLADGIDTKDDPTGQYVLFQMARNLAANYGDVETAFEAIDQTAKIYKIDPLEEQAKVVIKIAGKTLSPDGRMAVVKLGLVTISQAVAQDKHALASRVAAAIIPVARKTKDYKLLKLLTVRKKQIGELTDKYTLVKKALARLEREPTNSKANQAVGEFRCFLKGNWVKGLPMLALGNDKTSKSLAIADLRGASTSSDQIKLGDGWWNYSQNNEDLKEALMFRAGYWYKKALPAISSGLMKAKLQKRLSEIAILEKTSLMPGVDPSQFAGSRVPRTQFTNLDFERQYDGWTKKGDGHQMESFVADGRKAYQGKYSYQTAVGARGIPGNQDNMTNELISKKFYLSKKMTTFSAFMAGGTSKQMYVGLYSAKDGKEICKLNNTKGGGSWHRMETAFKIPVDMLVYIMIVDYQKGAWGHIVVDQIEFK